jgi:GTPase SAR1 family protein
VNSCTIHFKDLNDSVDWKYTKIFGNDIEEVKAAIIVFNLSQKESFEYSKQILEYVVNTISYNYMPILLIGNKSDLIKSKDNQCMNWLNETVRDYVKAIPNCTFLEISCKDNTNVEQVRKLLYSIEFEQTKVIKKKTRYNSCLIF